MTRMMDEFLADEMSHAHTDRVYSIHHDWPEELFFSLVNHCEVRLYQDV